MQKPTRTRLLKGSGVTILVAALLLAISSQSTWATTCDDICTYPGNERVVVPGVGGVCRIKVPTPVADESIIDCSTTSWPTIEVQSGGKLILPPKQVGTDDLSCPDKPATWMAIIAGDLTILNGGEITGSYPGPGVPGGLLNAGTIAIRLSHVDKTGGGTTGGNLVIEPGGKLTSCRHARGNGRSGVIGVETEGQIDVQAAPDGSSRGEIDSCGSASSVFAFNKGCGRAEITLLAKGDNAPANEAIRIAGLVDMADLHDDENRAEDFLGGVITLIGGVKIAQATTAFPNTFDLFANPPTHNFRTTLPVTKPNPPDDLTKVLITETGIVNVNALDHGGGEVHILACYVTNNGLIQVGGDIHTDRTEGRETLLPTLIEIIAHEDIKIMPAVGFEDWLIRGLVLPGVPQLRGGIRADLRAGFRRHDGQGLTDPTLQTGTGCSFTPQTPFLANGPISSAGKGGADVCLIAGRSIEVDSKLSDQFAVRARTGKLNDNLSSSAQTGGTILAMTTREGNDIELRGHALTTNGVNSNAKGGRVVVQASGDLTVTGPLPNLKDLIYDPSNPNDMACYGHINANGGGKGPAQKGGEIWLEATSGAITAADGKLCALPDGVIKKRECVVNPADNPHSNPPEIDLPPQCDNPQLVRNIPALLPCEGCSCIDDVSLSGSTVTIKGHNLDAVKQVAFAPTCAPDNQCVVNVPFEEQNDSTIKVEVPTCAQSGDHVIVGDPNFPPGGDGILGTLDDVSPSTSCSRDTYPF